MSSKYKVLKSAAAALAILAAMPAVPFAAHADVRSESNEAYLKGFRMFQGGDYRGARIELLKALKANPNNGLARLLQARIALEYGGGIQAQTELERAVQAGIPAESVRHLRAHALILQRKLADAMDLLDARTIPPQFASYAARMRGRILTQQGKIPEARVEFETARRIAPSDPETLVDVARFMVADNKPADGGKLIDQVLASNPGNVKALLLKGDLVRRTQGLQPSLTFFNRALEVDPNNIEALLERAATLGDLRREKEARADLKRINGLMPDHPLALYLEAVLETRAGEYEKARALMTRTKGMLNTYVPALMLQGMLAYQANNIGQATEYFGKVVGSAPQSVLARKLYAAAQLRGDDVRGAIETLKPVVDSGAADGRTYAIYGAAFARNGNMSEAQKYLEKAVTEAPKESGLKTQLAMTQLLQGNSDAAEDALIDVLKADSKSMQALMVLSLIQLRDQQYEKAAATATRIINLYPDLPVGYNIRGGAELGLAQIKKAEASFRQALAKKADYSEARRNLAQVLLSQGKTAEGERELKTILETNKNDTRTMLLLARAADSRGDVSGRLEWLRQAAASDPKNAGARIQLVQSYLEAQQQKRALDEVAALVRDFPESPQVLITAARTYEATGQPNRVESTINRLVTAQPDNPTARIMLARALEANKKVDAARQTFTRALTIANVRQEPIYGELIMFEARQNNLAGAKNWADKLRALDKKAPDADLLMARVYLARKQPAGAIPYLENARKLGFTFPVAQGLAEANVQQGKPAQAIAVLQQYRRANPKDQASLISIAEIQLNAKQYKASAATYEALIKMNKGKGAPAVLNNLAWAYSKLNDPRALSTAKQAYDKAPTLPAVLDTYGWVLLKSKKDPKQALSLLQRAAAATPGDPEVRYHLAVAYEVNGQRAKAVDALRSALKAPSFESRAAAQQLLGRISG